MDGSSGSLAVIRYIRLLLFVAAFRAAFAVSGDAPDRRATGLAMLDSGECGEAVSELLAARKSGDSSNVVMLGLSRALECEGRMVDALSATFADNRQDTAGRIDLLLFRAQLLRKVGLGDEADKVEREIGQFVSRTVDQSADAGSDPWIWFFSGNVQASWLYEGDAVQKADSLEYYSTKAKGNVEGISTILPDSVIITGAQVPVAGGVQFDAMKGNISVSLAVPGQLILAKTLDSWLAGSSGVRLSSTVQWSDAFGSDLVLSGNRTWYPVEDRSSLHRTEIVGQLSNKLKLGATTISQTNSISRALGYSDEFSGYTGSHSVGVGRKLPWNTSVSANAGIAWFWDGSVDEFIDLPTRVVMVGNGRVGQATQRDTSLQFLDTAGRRIDPNSLDPFTGPGMLALGAVPGQWTSYSSLAFPIQTAAGFHRWNAGFAVGQKPTSRISLSASFDLTRTGWGSEYPGCYQDVDTVVTGLVSRGSVYLYRDARTGQDFWVKNPAKSHLSLLLFRAGPRVDWTTTTTLSASIAFPKRISVAGAWTSVVNRSNLAAYISGASYTRSIWNLSASVGW